MKNDEFEKKLVDALPLMYGYALKLTGGEDRARDLVQETAVKALSKYYCYVTDENFKCWLYTILYNTFLNDCKREARCVYVDDNVLSDMAFCDVTVDACDMMCVVSLLPKRFGVPLEMLISGYKYCEIADTMDIPIGTVKSRINKARNCLRESVMA